MRASSVYLILYSKHFKLTNCILHILKNLPKHWILKANFLFRGSQTPSYGIYLRSPLQPKVQRRALIRGAVSSLPFPLKRGKSLHPSRGRIFLVESGAIIYAFHLDHAAQLEEA
jgi:hypothetical protein